MPWDAPGSTAIVVLTPEAEPITGDWYRLHAKAGREGMRPHVTLLSPFIPADLFEDSVDTRLRELFSGFAPLDYMLERIERLPDGILYLAPVPAGPFVDLTNALVSAFPGYPPYDGVHDEVIPHATIAVSDDAGLLADVAAAVEPRLPIRCRAVEATVVERGADLRWKPRTTVPFGSLE
jgi:hypothetical protein